MTEEQMARLRIMLGLGTNTYQDDTIKEFAEETIQDMVDSGVLEEVARSSLAVGNIFRGIIDKWNYNTGADYSPMWIKRTNQLRNITKEELIDRVGNEQLLAVTLGLVEYKETIYSTIENQTEIDIPSTLNYEENDILTVFVNGNRMIENVQYTKTLTQIIFVNPLEIIGTPIELSNVKLTKKEAETDGNV